MSEHPYPPDEHCEHYAEIVPLSDIMLGLHEKWIEAESRAHDAEMVALRYEEGVMCLQWELSKLMKRGKVRLKPEKSERRLQELVVFAHVGVVPTWIRAARRELKGER